MGVQQINNDFHAQNIALYSEEKDIILLKKLQEVQVQIFVGSLY